MPPCQALQWLLDMQRCDSPSGLRKGGGRWGGEGVLGRATMAEKRSHSWCGEAQGLEGRPTLNGGVCVREGLLKRRICDLPLRVKGVIQAEMVGRYSRRKEQPVRRQEVNTEHAAGTGSAYGGARKVVRLREVRLEQMQCWGVWALS